MKVIDKINGAISDRRPFYSFEFFPPKTEAGVINLYERLERMSLLEPAFIDVTWGAGGTTAQLTLEISANAQKFIGLDVMMHLTCTNISKEEIHAALVSAKDSGIKNILALRGDPPRGSEAWEQCAGGFANAVDLVRYIRQEFGDYFGICVAGYPEGHSEATDLDLDLQYLKEKVEAGADLVITQLFYDVDLFLEFVYKARSIGIACPIIPGIMPIQNYGAFLRMTTFCKTKVPDQIRKELEPIKDDDAAVKDYGVKYGIEMCRRLLENAIPGIHFYTLNLERSVKLIMRGLRLIEETEERRLPWKSSEVVRRKSEDVRPIFWSNRPESYMQRTFNWDDFPNGRWGDSRSPAYGDLTDYHLFSSTSAKVNDRLKMWGPSPSEFADIYRVFEAYLDGKVKCLPWCDGPIKAETAPLIGMLKQLNRAGYLTINSQPRVNGASSTDKSYGWGQPDGYVYQKAYLEFFVDSAMIFRLVDLIKEFPLLSFHAVNADGKSLENVDPNSVNAVTWGAFPNSEIIQPTVVDTNSFLTWKDEAFSLWLSEWASIYDKNGLSFKLLQQIHDSFFLVNIVDNDYVRGSMGTFVEKLLEIPVGEL